LTVAISAQFEQQIEHLNGEIEGQLRDLLNQLKALQELQMGVGRRSVVKM